MAIHLDGARIWNALVKKNESPKHYGSIFDTISVCLSKGLGCPSGSVLIGSKEKIDKALRIRKVLGGGMRQVGYLAACGLYALENNIQRLSLDHKKAKEIETTLNKLNYIDKVEPVETNIIIFQIKKDIDSETFLKNLNQQGIKIISMGGPKLRIVTHLDYNDKLHERFLNILKGLTF